jgi:hypothetical protein
VENAVEINPRFDAVYYSACIVCVTASESPPGVRRHMCHLVEHALIPIDDGLLVEVRVKVDRKNWRRVTLLTGAHVGVVGVGCMNST